jgi:hypothetical protein
MMKMREKITPELSGGLWQLITICDNPYACKICEDSWEKDRDQDGLRSKFQS